MVDIPNMKANVKFNGGADMLFQEMQYNFYVFGFYWSVYKKTAYTIFYTEMHHTLVACQFKIKIVYI